MSYNRPIFWHQGLFLQPQHFQLEDRYLQSLLNPVYRFVTPHLWGIGDLEIQTAALGNLSFNLLRGDFLFPDNTHVVFPGNALVEARSFEGSWVQGGKPFTVYAGIRKWRDASTNVTVLPDLGSISQVTTRYVTTTDPEEIHDSYENGPLGHVKRLHYVVKVFWETEKEQLGEYQVIPIARLERSDEEIVLSKNFIYPSLHIAASTTLMKLIRDIRDQVAARGRQLESYKRERGIHTAEFGARDMVYLLALRSLNRYIPLLFHFTESGQVHPWTAYAVLRQLIGELSSFSEQVNVLGELSTGGQILPEYDHRDLWACFSSAQALVTRLLQITAEPEYVIPLIFDGTYFGAELSQKIFEGRNRFYLVAETEADPQRIIPSVESIAKLGSRESLPILIARALPGIKLEHLPTPPQELPRRAHSIYFRINHHSDQWLDVEKGTNIAFYWDLPPQDLKLELMVVGRQ